MVLGKRINEGANLTEYMRHTGLPVTDNFCVGVPTVHDQQAEKNLAQDCLDDGPTACFVCPIIGAALIGEYP